MKFLALLPSLNHDKWGRQVKRILLETIRRLRDEDKSLAQGGAKKMPRRTMLSLTLLQFLFRLTPAFFVAAITRSSVRFMARRFIAGENIHDAVNALKNLQKNNRQATLDQLGELVVSEEEAESYKQQIIAMIGGFKGHIAEGRRNDAGINHAHISIKVSALGSFFQAEAFEETYKRVGPRLREILLCAKQAGVFINIRC